MPISTFMRITDIQIIFPILIAYEWDPNLCEKPVFTCLRSRRCQELSLIRSGKGEANSEAELSFLLDKHGPTSMVGQFQDH